MQSPSRTWLGRVEQEVSWLAFELVMGALAAAYGIWLLHRHQHQHQHRHADHSGEDGQFSAPQEPPAA
jgi:hypothetical protein